MCLPDGRGRRPLPRGQPGARLHEGGKLKPPKRGKAPFEDGELERLWKELGRAEYERVYLYACRVSAETGLRLGELIALDWTNVDLLNGRVRVEHQWDDATGTLIEPKDRESRVVYLTPHARKCSTNGSRSSACRARTGLPGPAGGRLGRRVLQRRFVEAMEGAGSRSSTPTYACQGRSIRSATRRACSCSGAATTRG